VEGGGFEPSVPVKKNRSSRRFVRPFQHFPSERNRGFESRFLQRRVACEPEDGVAFRCRVETARNHAMAFRGHLLTRLRAFRHACRGSGVNHSGLSRRWALAPPQPVEAFSDRGIPVGAEG